MKEKRMTTITLKKMNRDKVYQYIYQQKETSKLQIVQDLQMGLSTVSQNLNDLETSGLISRNGYFESTGGRKAQIIRIVEDFRISIGLGILKDMFHIVAVNLYGDAIATETISLPYKNSDAYYNELAENVEQFISNHQYPSEKPKEFPLPLRALFLRMERLSLMVPSWETPICSFLIFHPDCHIRAIWNTIPNQLPNWNCGIIRNLTVH